MKCASCQRDNEPTARFCIFCGAALPIAEPGSAPPQTSGEQTGDVQWALRELQEEVRRLRPVIGLINDRLARLEQMEGIATPVSPQAAAPKATDLRQTAPATKPVPAVASGGEAAPVQAKEFATAGPVSPAPPPNAAPRKTTEWEQVLGGNWLAWVGIFALTIGVAFFLKLAFDNRWSGPGVIVGIGTGLAMLGCGYYWHRRYPVFAQALSGGGFAFLYLSIYGAFAIFHLVSIYPALIAIFLVSLGSATLAVRQNSMALAILGILGAFSAPLVLGYSAPRAPTQTPGDQGIQLIAYVLIVDIGVLALSSFRNWRWFTLMALLGSLMVYGGWHDKSGARLLTSEVSLTLIFLIFVGATTLFHLRWRRASSGTDYALMILNAASYFGISYGLMWTELHGWMGAFSLLLSLFYIGLARMASRRGAERLSLFATGIAVVFLTVAVPVQFGNRATTTVAWATEGAVLMWLHFRLGMSSFRFYSYAAFALVALRLAFFDTRVDMRTFQPVLNARTLAFLFSIATMYLMSYLTWRDKRAHAEIGGNGGGAHGVFLVGANLFSYWVIAAEAGTISARLPASAVTLVFFILMAGVTTLFPLFWRRPSRIIDFILLTVGAAFYLGISSLFWGSFRSWMGSVYLLFALFHGGLAIALFRRGKEKTLFADVALAIALVFFTVAIPTQSGGRSWTAMAWAGEMAALMWLSFVLLMPKFRVYSYIVFIIMAGRILLFDSALGSKVFVPVLNWRFLTFAAAIAAAYLTAYQLYRRRRESPYLAVPASTLFIAANFFSLWLLSLELWDYFGSSSAAGAEYLRNAQRLSLTALWAVYAMVLLGIGIAKRWRQVRLWALVLIAIPIIKLFLYDVFVLQPLYRVIAFAGLGFLLLVGGYLYQRFGKAVKGFLVQR